MINLIEVKDIEDPTTKLLFASIEVEEMKKLQKQADERQSKTDVQLAMVISILTEALNLFEKRFDSDANQILPSEELWYKDAAILVNEITGRPHKVRELAAFLFAKTMGEC